MLLLRLLLSVGVTLIAANAWSASQSQIDTARTNGLAWLYQNQKGDGSWKAAAGLEVQSTSAALEAFMNAGIQRGNAYNAALAKLANVQPGSVDGQARQLATLKRAGSDVTQQSTQLQSGRNYYKAWGALPGYGTSAVDTALALSALIDATPSYSNNDIGGALCNAIIPMQQASGGWSYTGFGTAAPASSSGAGIVPTAYMVLLLQKINASRFPSLSCGSTGYTVSTLINNGINFLVSKQSPSDHGFGDNGSSGVLETALAYKAIYAVNPTHSALGPAQDYLIARQSSGAWGTDPLQTALALQTLPATTLTDTSQDGIPDVIKTALNVHNGSDGRNLLPGNGQSVAGVTSSLVVASAVLNQAFNYTINGSGGTGPYTFSVLTGSLPDGLTLSSTGAISGTPTTAGPFNFTYQIRDSLNAMATVAGQIAVNEVPGVEDTDVPTLPEWGAILMGGLLLLSMAVADRRRTGRSIR